MIGGAVCGVPLGVAALVAVDPWIIRGCVGAFLLCYGLWDLIGETDGEVADESAPAAVAEALPYGFAAGFLGGAIAEPGPIAVVLGQSRQWAPPTMRAMLQRFFIPVRAGALRTRISPASSARVKSQHPTQVQVTALSNFAAAGLLTPEVVAQAAAALPLVAGAVVRRRRGVFPRRASRHFPSDRRHAHQPEHRRRGVLGGDRLPHPRPRRPLQL